MAGDYQLRPACARQAAFPWMSLALAELSCSELVGVTSFVHAGMLTAIERYVHALFQPPVGVGETCAIGLLL